MKNIHVLPTDKPSRLFIGRYRKELFLCDKPTSNIFIAGQNKHTYITSDEEIKRYGEYYLDIDTNEVKTSFENMGKYSSNEKKIILTTDQDLINDGVQSIDDEFLEWFVNNPSCEEVEVNKLCYGALSGYADAGYKIIISKEEPKKEYNYIGECNGNKGNGCFMDSSGHDCGCFIRVLKEEPKQETLEEGAKWHAEKMYSEEDMMDYSNYRLLIKKALSPKEWFEKFKNK
jgi:hypothetical protein